MNLEKVEPKHSSLEFAKEHSYFFDV